MFPKVTITSLAQSSTDIINSIQKEVDKPKKNPRTPRVGDLGVTAVSGEVAETFEVEPKGWWNFLDITRAIPDTLESEQDDRWVDRFCQQAQLIYPISAKRLIFDYFVKMYKKEHGGGECITLGKLGHLVEGAHKLRGQLVPGVELKSLYADQVGDAQQFDIVLLDAVYCPRKGLLLVGEQGRALMTKRIFRGFEERA